MFRVENAVFCAAEISYNGQVAELKLASNFLFAGTLPANNPVPSGKDGNCICDVFSFTDTVSVMYFLYLDTVSVTYFLYPDTVSVNNLFLIFDPDHKQCTFSNTVSH